MIHPLSDKTFVISSGHVWLPGCYESERAAKYAFRFTDEQLRKLQDSVNPGHIITFKMLQDERSGEGIAEPSHTG